MSETGQHLLVNGAVSASISAAGAELGSLRDGQGHEYMWQAGPEWPRHSPVLFPIVGQLKDDTILIDGTARPMTKHGFARDRVFHWDERTATTCRLSLTEDEASLAVYPFAFRLEIAYALDGQGLSVRYVLTNTGERPMPASLGTHPAFAWPIAGSAAPKTGHRLVFETDEPGPVFRLDDGLLDPTPLPSPINGQTLALDPHLFSNDALLLLEVRSRSVRFEAQDGPALAVSWQGFSQLGVWSKPEGADFLCIEPWEGYASPVGFDGPFETKPGVFIVAPGASVEFGWRVEIAGESRA